MSTNIDTHQVVSVTITKKPVEDDERYYQVVTLTIKTDNGEVEHTLYGITGEELQVSL